MGDDMNKKGFTLIEVIVSVVLVSVVMISLVSSLIQLRQTYTKIHENSDIIVYSSSISRVINNDLTQNNGIRYVSCTPDRKECNMILGNDQRRQLLIEESSSDPTEEDGVKYTNVKTTLRYINTTNNDEKKLLYIRTLELDKYEKGSKETTKGYNFLDMTFEQKEHADNVADPKVIDTYTTLIIRIYDGILEDVSKYNITLYTAGRYDISGKRGEVYTIGLDSAGASTVGTSSIDEVFGVGYFVTDSNHNVGDRIYKIEVPTKSGEAFLGYYYSDPARSGIEEVIIDGEGRIVASSYFFKNNVEIDLTNSEVIKVYAKWGPCKSGYKVENGKCVAEACDINLDVNDTADRAATKQYTTHPATYLRRIPDLTSSQLPTREGYVFKGYKLESTGTMYFNATGINTLNIIATGYNNPSCLTLKAQWEACPTGQYSLLSQDRCYQCVKGTYAGVAGSKVCTPCNGKTTTGSGGVSCNVDCPNNAHAGTWQSGKWNANTNTLTTEADSTVSGDCMLNTCEAGYHVKNPNTPQNECEITTPATPTISASSNTIIYGSSDITLTCSTSTNYASGTTKYYSFGYSTSDGGEPGSWTTASTSATLTVSKTLYVGDRYYSCRVYASDGTTKYTSSTVTSLSSADAMVRINNATVTFNATTNGGTLDGTGTLYTKSGQKKFFTGIRNSTEGTIPVAKRAGYKFNGWYTAASGGTQIIKPDKSVPNNITFTTNTTLYAQFSSCPKGQWNDGTKTTCTKCGEGKYSTTEAATSSSSCTNCPSGYPNSAAGSDARTDCYRVDNCTKETAASYGSCGCGGTYTSSCSCSRTNCNHTGCNPSGTYIVQVNAIPQTTTYCYADDCGNCEVSYQACAHYSPCSGCVKNHGVVGAKWGTCTCTTYSCQAGVQNGDKCEHTIDCTKTNAANHTECSCSGTYSCSKSCSKDNCNHNGCQPSGTYTTYSN